MDRERIRAAYRRMAQASADLHIYLRSPAQNSEEYDRLFAILKAATEEYHLLTQILEDEYAEALSRVDQKRSA